MVGVFILQKASQCTFLQASHECVVNYQNQNKHRRGGLTSSSEELLLFFYVYIFIFSLRTRQHLQPGQS